MKNMERMDGRDLIERSLRKTATQKFRENEWGERHVRAFRSIAAWGGNSSQEAGMIQMIYGWAEYADAHFHRFESLIGEDGFLGPAWLAMGKGIRALLNGETGRLDCGTLDGLILEIAEHNGFNEEDL